MTDDLQEMREAIEDVIDQEHDAVRTIMDGQNHRDERLNYLVGKVMEATNGQHHPADIRLEIRRKLRRAPT